MAIKKTARKVDSAEVKELQGIVNRVYPDVLSTYHDPMITQKPVVEEDIEGCNTAYINLKTHEQKISRSFVDGLVKKGLDAAVAVKGISTHEVDHYMKFPREPYVQIFLQQQAQEAYKSKGHEIYGRYSDAIVNLDCLASERRKDAVADLLKKMADGSDPIGMLMAAVYQEVIKNPRVDLGVDLSKLKHTISAAIGPGGAVVHHIEPKKYMEAFDKLKRVQYFETDPFAHLVNLRMFGDAIKDLIPDPDGSGGSGGDGGSGSGGKGGRSINSGGDTGEVKNYSDADIDDALKEIAHRLGKVYHDKAVKFVNAQKPWFNDAAKPSSDQKFAGIASADIHFNDEEIPFYKRKAAKYGVYIAAKPRKTNSQDAYPEQNIPFESGDPLNKLNPWSSPMILPGISKKRKDSHCNVPEWQYKIPDLFVLLDTSGSMKHPKWESEAVLTAFVLGKNYHANDAKAGMMNFSADALLLPPTRDIEQFYKAACAYWGGGTVINIERLKHMFQEMAKDKKVKLETTGEPDYMKMLESLDDEHKRMVEEKRLNLKLDQKLSETYSKIDNVLITDGAIMNIEDVVDYMNDIAVQARNTIFLIENPAEYEAWQKLELKNTTIHHIGKEDDLVGVAIKSSVKRMADTEKEKSNWSG